MRTYTCKCGGTITIGTKTPPACRKCAYCTSGIGIKGQTIPDAEPHDWVPYGETRDRMPKRYKCSKCGWEASQLDKYVGGL